MNNSPEKIWAVISAAGTGKRMGYDIPKQYLPLTGKPVLQWTIEKILQVSDIQSVIVSISKEDKYWTDLSRDIDAEKVKTVDGGKERCYSVLNALRSLQEKVMDNDWILVHDAARPCVRVSDIKKLLHQCRISGQGGVLAIPVRDTIKLSDETGKIIATQDRNRLWHALTPQCFRYRELLSALEIAISDNLKVTDEASAIEHYGKHPLLVEGHSDNIKVTLPADLSLAEYFLTQQAHQ